MRRLDKKTRTRIIILSAFFSAAAVAGGWYANYARQTPLEGFEVNHGAAGARVFVASEYTAYKDQLLKAVAGYYEDGDVNLVFSDASALDGLDESAWDAVIIISSVRYHSQNKAVESFLERTAHPGKVFLFSTSSSTVYESEAKVQALTRASDDADGDSRLIINAIEGILNR